MFSNVIFCLDETTVNRDTAFQKNMIEIILESFEDPSNEHAPFDYWESVIGEEFSHTVENIFYMSFLLKEDIITAWVSFGYSGARLPDNRLPDNRCLFTATYGTN